MNNNGKIIKVALYARVSTEEQKDNFSLAAQIELTQKHAVDNGFEVYDEYVDDGYSGMTDQRPHLQRMLSDARQGKFQLILMYKLDRFFRKNRLMLETVEKLNDLGIGIRAITEPIDTSNPTGMMLLGIYGSMAEYERQSILARSKMGKQRRAREGYYSGSSPAKFGYTYNKETRKLDINEKEAEAVKLIYELYNQPDSSLVKVTRKLRALGYRTKENNPMREDVVHDALRDTIYAGRWYANRHDSKTGGLRPKEEWIEVKVPQVVSEEAFLKAQEYLNIRRNYSIRNAKYNYLLQSMVKCNDCGSTIAGTADKQFQERNGKKYGPYFKLYYRCTHFFKNKYEKLVTCRLKYIQAKKLEDTVWDQIEKIFQNPHLIEHSIKNKEEAKISNKESAEKEIERISALQVGLTKEEQRILEAYRQGIISIELLRGQMDSLRKQRESLEQRRQELRNSLNGMDKKTEVKQGIDYIEKVKQGISKFNYETKKQVLKLFNTSIKVNINGIVDIDCFLPKIPTCSEEDFLSYIKLPRYIF